MSKKNRSGDPRKRSRRINQSKNQRLNNGYLILENVIEANRTGKKGCISFGTEDQIETYKKPDKIERIPMSHGYVEYEIVSNVPVINLCEAWNKEFEIEDNPLTKKLIDFLGWTMNFNKEMYHDFFLFHDDKGKTIVDIFLEDKNVLQAFKNTLALIEGMPTVLNDFVTALEKKVA
jgi:hypothetical protein